MQSPPERPRLITTAGTVEDSVGNSYDGRFERVPSGQLEIEGASAIDTRSEPAGE